MPGRGGGGREIPGDAGSGGEAPPRPGIKRGETRRAPAAGRRDATVSAVAAPGGSCPEGVGGVTGREGEVGSSPGGGAEEASQRERAAAAPPRWSRPRRGARGEWGRSR